MAFGAVGQPEQELIELQYQLIKSLREASPDNAHIAHHLYTLLSRVFPSIPGSMTQSRPDARPSSTETPYDRTSSQGEGAGLATTLAPNPFNTTSALPWLGFDLPSANGADVLDWDTGVVSGFGYDPSSIISDIEQMLAAANGGAEFGGL